MSSYMNLDSNYREFSKYPNPASYTIQSKQVSRWNIHPRRAININTKMKKPEQSFDDVVEITEFILPYVSITYIDRDGNTVNSHTADLQRIYLNIHSSGHEDRDLVETPMDINSNGFEEGNKLNRIKFILTRRLIQTDQNGDKAWIIFNCNMNQVLRINRRRDIYIDIMQEDGNTIIIDDTGGPLKSKQTYITLKITPMELSDLYTNQLEDLYSM